MEKKKKIVTYQQPVYHVIAAFIKKKKKKVNDQLVGKMNALFQLIIFRPKERERHEKHFIQQFYFYQIPISWEAISRINLMCFNRDLNLERHQKQCIMNIYFICIVNFVIIFS